MRNAPNPVFARRVRSCRLRAGLTQAEVAKRLFYAHAASVWQWESGNHVPPMQTVDALAELFGVSPEFLTGSEIA